MNRAGEYIKNLSGESEYKSFRPTPLPPNPPIELDSEAVQLLVDANKKLALLAGLSSRIPNIELFVAMYVRKEALVSSQIEGTQCTLDDILNPNIDANANNDVSDVINYIKATEYALDRLKTLPLCNRLIRETHAILMKSVRGYNKTPGEFRHSQNWIGGQGSTIKTARYVPPSPQDMLESIAQLEKYLNDDNDDLDVLIKVALIHYQFETIHPFLDGNGRIGRLLIILYLIQKKILDAPVLYMSCYLKSNRIEYYDRMSEVRKTGNYEQWIKFFLQAITTTAIDAIETIDKLTNLRISTSKKIQTEGNMVKKLELFVDYLEKNPIIEIKKTAQSLNISYNTVAKYVEILCRKKILIKSSQIGKTQIYSYDSYLSILRKDT